MHLKEIDQIHADSKNHLMGTLKIEILKLTNTYAEAIMPVTQIHQQPMGFLHGGATIALAETLGGIGSFYLLEENYYCVGMQISANHIATTTVGDKVIAKARLLHQGRRSHIWDIHIYSEKMDKLISSVRVTNAILEKPSQK